MIFDLLREGPLLIEDRHPVMKIGLVYDASAGQWTDESKRIIHQKSDVAASGDELAGFDSRLFTTWISQTEMNYQVGRLKNKSLWASWTVNCGQAKRTICELAFSTGSEIL
jgi:hypothetical protein